MPVATTSTAKKKKRKPGRPKGSKDSYQRPRKSDNYETSDNNGRQSTQTTQNRGDCRERSKPTPDDDFQLARDKLRSMTRKGDATAAKILHVFATSEVAEQLKQRASEEHLEVEYKSLPTHIINLVRKIDVGLAETYRRYERGLPMLSEEREIAIALASIYAKQRVKRSVGARNP